MKRFWDKVDKSGDCWEWAAACNSSGYGHIKLDGAMILAHRLSWILANGPIPDNLCICHTCDNRTCVNPDHLWLGTRADNNSDMTKKGRRWGYGYDKHSPQI